MSLIASRCSRPIRWAKKQRDLSEDSRPPDRAACFVVLWCYLLAFALMYQPTDYLRGLIIR